MYNIAHESDSQISHFRHIAIKITMAPRCNLVQVTGQINMLRCCVNLEKLTTAHCLKEWLLWATIILNNSCDKEDRTGHRPHTHKRSHMTDREHCPLHPHPHPHVNVYVCTYEALCTGRHCIREVGEYAEV